MHLSLDSPCRSVSAGPRDILKILLAQAAALIGLMFPSPSPFIRQSKSKFGPKWIQTLEPCKHKQADPDCTIYITNAMTSPRAAIHSLPPPCHVLYIHVEPTSSISIPRQGSAEVNLGERTILVAMGVNTTCLYRIEGKKKQEQFNSFLSSTSFTVPQFIFRICRCSGRRALEETGAIVASTRTPPAADLI